MATSRSLTPELRTKILALVRAGNTPYSSARACGVAKSTWYAWLKAGREGDDPTCAELVRELKTAVAASQASLVALVRSAAARDWRAALALLERRWPKSWGRKDRHAVTVAPSEATTLTEDDRRRIEALIREEAERVRGRRLALGSSEECSADGMPGSSS